MPNDRSSKLFELRKELRNLDQRFERELRARGFDPAQAENVALPSALARLYAEREELRLQLERFEGKAQELKPMSMREIERIQDQLRLAFEGGAWHGPAVLELLREVSANQAAERPIPGAHSIWEITLHIAAWESAARRRLEGDRAELATADDWPALKEITQEAWQSTRATLEKAHQELVVAIARLDDSRLDEPILEGLSSVYVTLHGVVQHDLYHAGQIAILKKAMSSGGKPPVDG